MDSELEQYLNRRAGLVMKAGLIGGPELARTVSQATSGGDDDDE